VERGAACNNLKYGENYVFFNIQALKPILVEPKKKHALKRGIKWPL